MTMTTLKPVYRHRQNGAQHTRPGQTAKRARQDRALARLQAGATILTSEGQTAVAHLISKMKGV